jgi:[acyl-carrier-protein] S-malonyltransferase
LLIYNPDFVNEGVLLAMRAAVLFPGQGSQHVGMADPWLDHPAGKERLEKASSVLGWDVVEASRDPEALKRTEIVQLAVVACDLAAYDVLVAEGVTFEAAAGHSLGEYAALCAVEAVDFESGFATLAARADAMEHASGLTPGGMTALIGISMEDARQVAEVAGRGGVLTVANQNGARQIVLSGTISAIERAEELARSRGAKAVRLHVAGAFHSPLMEPALQPVRDVISRLDIRTPRFPIVPNASGKPTTQPLVIRDLLSRHLISPVLWGQSMHAMADAGIDWFVEAGPGDVLSKLARRILPQANVRSVRNPDEARAVAEELRRTALEPASEPGRDA